MHILTLKAFTYDPPKLTNMAKTLTHSASDNFKIPTGIHSIAKLSLQRITFIILEMLIQKDIHTMK